MKKYYKQIFAFYRMRIKTEKITNIENHQVYKITFTNKNNYVISFYNFGGYINNIFIPYHNNLHKHEDVLLITSAIDNLLKGASGQAVQNMNLIFGLEENLGLNLKAGVF